MIVVWRSSPPPGDPVNNVHTDSSKEQLKKVALIAAACALKLAETR